ncbi:hypothetical protein PHYSODRAFT_413872, partial [Phytophthora sojae]
LRMKYDHSEEVLALLPSASQVKNRAHRLRRRGDIDITTYADVMVWATPRLCTTSAAFFGHMRYNRERDARRIARKPFEFQNELIMLGVTDGTYKLHFGGWTLVSFGTFGLRYTASHAYQQKFYPMAFMFVRTE